MKRYLDTVKGRVVLAFTLFVGLAHMGGLWLFSVRSEAAINLLHDALISEQVALLVRAAESSPMPDRERAIAVLNGRIVPGDAVVTVREVDQTRSHLLRHLLGAILKRETDAGIGVEYFKGSGTLDTENMVYLVNATAHMDQHHQRYTPIAEIKREGTIVASISLEDGSTLRMAIPAFTATSFSFSNLGAAIATMVFFAMMAAVWMLHRWTQPLVLFAAAADNLGSDIQAPPLPVQGLYEVRTAASAFNRMQERIQRFVEDRSAMAAAIAHDLGTPVTRLRLRAEEIENPNVKRQVLEDIEQMRRMISSTLEFSRLNSDSLSIEAFDLTSLVEAVCSEFSDLGGNVTFSGPIRLSVVSDPTSLRRVLTNLVDNALKYGGSAQVSLTSDSEIVSILVDDVGPGIPAELRVAAIAPFSRLHNSEGKVPAGSGLGLAVAQGLAARLGGHIDLAQSPLGGLRVAVVFPRHRPLQGNARRAVGISGGDAADDDDDVRRTQNR